MQHAARKLGNSEFLNEELEPHQDQWSYLASLPRITPARLGELIAELAEDLALAVRSATENLHVPWRPPPTLRERLGKASMPEAVAATLADRLYIDRSALPPLLGHALKRLATFSNPMFVELQRMRMSVARTPRVIGCFKELDRRIALRRGCLADVKALLAELGVQLELEDERVSGERLCIKFGGNLNDTQQRAVNAMLDHEIGVLCAPPGWGKTVAATS